MARITEHHVEIVSINTIICSMAEKIANNVGGLSVTQYRVLLRLCAQRKPVTMKNLSKQLMLSQSTATAAVDKLEQRQAAQRTASKQDRRIVRVQLAPQGITLIKEIDKGLADPIARAWNMITDEQRSVMASRCVEVTSHFGLTRAENDRIRLDTAFLDTALLLHAQIVKAARAFNLSVNDYRVLYQLSVQPEGARASQLARELLMRLPEVTVAANKLVERSLVKRDDDPVDRRASLLEVTNEGYALIRKAAPLMAEYILNTHPAETEIIDTHDAIVHIWAEDLRTRWMVV